MRVVRPSFDEIAGSHSEGLVYDLLLNIPLPRARLSGKLVGGMELLENKRFCRGGRIPRRTRDYARSRFPKFSLFHSVPGPPAEQKKQSFIQKDGPGFLISPVPRRPAVQVRGHYTVQFRRHRITIRLSSASSRNPVLD
jgi:hypothetical protein